MKPDDGKVSDPLIRDLRAVVRRSPDLKEAAKLYEILLPLLRDAEGHVTPVSLSIEQVRAKLATGTPLLQGIALEFDPDKIHELMLRLAVALENSGGKRGGQYRRIRRTLEEGRVEADTLIASIAANTDATVTSTAQEFQVDPDLLRVLVHNSLKPAMRLLCGQLTPLVDGIPWDRGYCFICGSGAALGELRDHQLQKHLRCGQCGADWAFPRLRCNYCGNDDHHTLGLLYPDPWDGNTRVEICDKCKGYLKVIVSFTSTPADRLPIEDLATLHLDYIAQAQGYKRVPVGSDDVSLHFG
jgi:formate dehydrogenase maturation protein FdhE